MPLHLNTGNTIGVSVKSAFTPIRRRTEKTGGST